MSATRHEISFADAMKAIEQHTERMAHWAVKAQTLLQLAGRPGADIDRAKLAEQCRAHAEKLP